MKVEIFLWANRINNCAAKTAVVIDVLRASSTIITSLSNGAQEIRPKLSIEAAKEEAEKTTNSLVAGERDGVKVEGFDLGNSPLEHQRSLVQGKKVILTTTNGTRCFKQLGPAKEVIVASFLNLTAVVDYLKTKKQVVLCCAGNYNEFAIDDFIVAGKIIAELKKQVNLKLSDKGKLALQLYNFNQDNLLELLLDSASGKNLINLGNQQDVEYIVKGEEKELIPYYKNDKIVINNNI